VKPAGVRGRRSSATAVVKGDDIVAHFGFDFVDALHAEIGALPDRLGRRTGNHSSLGQSFGGSDFHSQPGTKAVFRHSRCGPFPGGYSAGSRRVRLLSMLSKSGTEDSKWSGKKRPAQGGRRDSFAASIVYRITIYC